jgi:tetratricopeptide (TPR) repeat protein
MANRTIVPLTGAVLSLTLGLLPLAASGCSHKKPEARALFEQGNSDVRKGDDDQAIAYPSQVIAPKTAASYAFHKGRGWSYTHKGEFNKAIAEFSEAIRLNPSLSSAYCDRADCYLHRGDSRNKIDILGRLGTPRPGSESDYVHKDDYDKAIADYSQAIRLDPKNALAYSHRGWAHHGKREYDKAIADYTEAIRLDTESHFAANIYSFRAGAYRAWGKEAEAVSDQRKIQELTNGGRTQTGDKP